MKSDSGERLDVMMFKFYLVYLYVAKSRKKKTSKQINEVFVRAQNFVEFHNYRVYMKDLRHIEVYLIDKT